MASTTFVDYTTPAVNAAWLNDANDATYHEYNADLVAAELAAGVTPANPLYPAEDIRRYTGFQNAINVGNVIFPPGDYDYDEDFDIPSNRKIWVQKGAIVTNTGGRFTAWNVNNVEWQIDGEVHFVATDTASDLSGGETGSRGCIEFGESYSAASAANGFWVHGTGLVAGDWTGTPNVSDIANQINRKGIACWNSANVLVEGLRVTGFHGEAIYAFFFDEASSNIVFQNNSVYNCRFNALNFNAGSNGGGCIIQNNKADSCYQVESSVGEISGNYIVNMEAYGILTGSGAGNSIVIKNNIIKNAGLLGIATVYASGTPVTEVVIEDNIIIDPDSYAIYADYVRELTVVGNLCIGTGTGSGGYDIGVDHTLRANISGNTFVSPGGFAQASHIAISNSFDININSDNVALATTGTVDLTYDNGTASLASAATLTIPPLGKTFFITGTTNITSINAQDGREINLIFEGILTVTDGSNLKLAGNFVTSADDTMKLVCRGANWYEVSRSVN